MSDPALESTMAQKSLKDLQYIELLPDAAVQNNFVWQWAVLVSRDVTKYYMDYSELMKKLIKNGYAERVPEMSELQHASHSQVQDKANIWYIPHHGVYHPKKPNKIRVVFDCAAEYESESLNKHLL